MMHAEGIGLVSHEAQPSQVVLVEPEDVLVGAKVVEDDVGRVSAGRPGQKPVEPSNDTRCAGQGIKIEDALEP
jgi:hypothetical protein